MFHNRWNVRDNRERPVRVEVEGVSSKIITVPRASSLAGFSDPVPCSGDELADKMFQMRTGGAKCVRVTALAAGLLAAVGFPACGSSRVELPQPAGVRLVRERIPDGPAFSVSAEHGESGESRFGLMVGIEAPGKPGADVGGSSSFTTVPKERSALAVQMSTGCAGAHPYTIVYGLLRSHGGTAIAHSPGHVSVLRHVAIPGYFHAGGELVYAVLPWKPDHVIARTAQGKTALDESYVGLSGEHCPGGEGATVGTVG